MMDGKRSTMFEFDMQLFYVEFDVLGAQVHNPSYFKPKFEKKKLFAQSVDSNGVVSLMPFEICTVEWQPYFDPDLDATFRAKYVAKAVVRRIDP